LVTAVAHTTSARGGRFEVAVHALFLKSGVFDAQNLVTIPEAKLIRSVGVISGGAPWDVLQAIDEGLDLYITGESSHGIYHHCLESRIHVIFAGHYQSEIFGVKALGEKLARETGLETVSIDVPTGL
jgi:putative NIF3 family GTP cyclohydrolase 1 type 2